MIFCNGQPMCPSCALKPSAALVVNEMFSSLVILPEGSSHSVLTSRLPVLLGMVSKKEKNPELINRFDIALDVVGNFCQGFFHSRLLHIRHPCLRWLCVHSTRQMWLFAPSQSQSWTLHPLMPTSLE